MKLLKVINIFKVLGSLTVFLLTISESTATSETPTSRFERAVVTAHIARELNQPTLSPALKSALLTQARPEDVTALKSLLARYKPQTGLKFSANFNRLLAYDKSSRIVFSAEIDPNNPKRFALNGREWILPESGSILSSLNKTVFKATAKKSAVIEVLFPFAHASQDTSPASVAAAYLFVSAGKKNGADAAEYLARKDVYNVLLRGADFPQAGAFAKVKSIFEALLMSPIKVQCTPAGAKGFALVSGTEVEFLAQNDLSVILKSRDHQQALKFVRRKEPVESLIENISKSLSSVLDQKDDQRERLSRALFFQVLRLCAIGRSSILSDASRKFCHLVDTKNKKDGNSNSNIPNEIWPWFESHPGKINDLLKEMGKTIRIHDQTGTIEACKNQECSQTVPDDLLEFRIPPNYTENSVRRALAFRPRNSPDAKTDHQYIRYSCATENQACKQVRIVNGDELSKSDLTQANQLASAANKDLEWNQIDPSVSQPVSVLRALGPCCEDAECRAKVIDRGADLIPTGSTSPQEVAK